MPTSFLRRMLGATWLDAETYEEVEHDRTATGQATAVVALSAVAAAIGGFENHGVGGILAFTLAALAGWVVWAGTVCWIGVRWLPQPQTESDIGELLRTLGFSSAPGILRLFGIVPELAGPLFAVTAVWMFVAMVIAVRQALDYCGTGRAILVCTIGFPVYALTLALTLLMLGPWPV
jgi:hypothetical protein